MPSYALSTKVTSIEVIDDGANGQGSEHEIRLWTYSKSNITQAADVDYRRKLTLKTGNTVKSPIFLRSLYSHKDIIKDSQTFYFSVTRLIPGDIWGAGASAGFEFDPSKSLGDGTWYIETHAASRRHLGTSKVKVNFTTKTLETPTNVMDRSGNIVAFANRDCQGSFLKLTDAKFSVNATPRGDKTGLPDLSDSIYRIKASDLAPMGNNIMSSIAYYNADAYYVWLYEHDFNSPLFNSGRSRRFDALPRWNATYVNLAPDDLLQWPDNSLDNKVSAIEVAHRKPPAIG